MGLIGDVLEYIQTVVESEKISEVKIDIGGGDIITPAVASSPGDDSPPLPGDYAVAVDTPGEAGAVVVGFIDPNNAGLAEGGERRFAARDAIGQEVVSIWLKKDGSIEVVSTLPVPIRLENSAGFVEIGADGAFNANDNFKVLS